MKVSTWLTISAVLAIAFGLSFLIVPGATLSLYGITLDKAGLLIAQFFGAALVGFATLNWFAREANGGGMRAVVLGNLVADAVGFVVALLGQLSGVANALGWSTVAIYLVLALGFAYFQFMTPASATKSSMGRP